MSRRAALAAYRLGATSAERSVAVNWVPTLWRMTPPPTILRKTLPRSNGAAPSRRMLRIAAVTFVAPFFVVWAAGLRINCSPSLPLGLYRTTTDSRAALIEFCPQEPYGTFAADRGYRSTRKLPGRRWPADETRDRQCGRHRRGLGTRNCCQWARSFRTPHRRRRTATAER